MAGVVLILIIVSCVLLTLAGIIALRCLYTTWRSKPYANLTNWYWTFRQQRAKTDLLVLSEKEDSLRKADERDKFGNRFKDKHLFYDVKPHMIFCDFDSPPLSVDKTQSMRSTEFDSRRSALSASEVSKPKGAATNLSHSSAVKEKLRNEKRESAALKRQTSIRRQSSLHDTWLNSFQKESDLTVDFPLSQVGSQHELSTRSVQSHRSIKSNRSPVHISPRAKSSTKP